MNNVTRMALISACGDQYVRVDELIAAMNLAREDAVINLAALLIAAANNGTLASVLHRCEKSWDSDWRHKTQEELEDFFMDCDKLLALYQRFELPSPY